MPVSQLLDKVDDAVLDQLFSNNAIARGRGYVGRVRRIEVAGNTLSADVQGSVSTPYHTSVRLERRDFFGEASIELATRCTCPVGNRCKHAVALLLAARRPGALQEKPRESVLAWAAALKRRIASDAAGGRPPGKTVVREAILFAIHCDPRAGEAELRLYKARMDARGGFNGRGEAWYNTEQALLRPPSFVREEDIPVFRRMRELQRKAGQGHLPVRLAGAGGLTLLHEVLETGRCFVSPDDDEPLRPLRAGAARPAVLRWQAEAAGVRPRVETSPPATMVLRTDPLWYLDVAAGEAGPADMEDQPAVRALLELPALSRAELPVVAAVLEEAAPRIPTPLVADAARLPVIEAPLQPVLFLDSVLAWQILPHRGYGATGHSEFDYAVPLFAYGGVTLLAGSDATLAALPDGRSVKVRRQPQAEARALEALRAAGFQPVPQNRVRSWETLPQSMLGLEGEAQWRRFFAEQAPRLRAAGWRIECEPDFRHHVLIADHWLADLEETEGGWLAVSLGIEVEGRRVDLAPLLHALFRADARWLDPATLAGIGDDESITLHDERGARILVPAGRIKPLARTLVDLFDSPAGGARRLSRMDAPRLAEALGEQWRREGFQQLEGWLERIRTASQVEPVPTPEGFGGELRPYQREGLAWLQHLRRYELAGILADDMGLGKTAQALAHLLVEKHAGRLDRPALVVLPTSLVFNWRREAERFAPQLRVLKLHGKERARAFARIPEHDVCLTTYPLLWRDREQLATHDYHVVILDEAQTVKNAASQAAQAVRELRTRHRLCITGTPLENHLGELWAQFDFLLPGFLGDARDFAARWRTPVEKHGNALRRELLAHRVAPFILRRRKEDVAKELPPKNIVVRTVELEGRQRDLYETVRATMDKRIRDEIAARGFARSQIVILDALLKLRQVCCDPRLLKTEAAAKVKERAKFDLLMDMLPELVEEGRRVLVFSQFTEMLALIEQELVQRRIGYTQLTGQTQKREQAIAEFQEGRVPVFLISLKAGGVGLNLTAADTVIHFDPWWNPAAENQATDRAHRIGQTKTVFVYKLVVAGSIEEKILGLQERKAELAAGILGEDREGAVKFGEDELRNLLAPLPAAE
ncbi:MAG: SWIM zinc finger family protein [Betaproteobacteria bacterium]|nr:SWIM zinc finger family protein [Betaproteobacteria bacterium]